MDTTKRDFIMDSICAENYVDPDRTEKGHVAENLFYLEELASDDPEISDNTTEYTWWIDNSEKEA